MLRHNFRKLLRGTKVLLPAYIKLLFRPIPIFVQLFVTRKCNLNCQYCFVKDNTKKELSTEDMKKVVDKLYYLGTRLVSFFGGEPTLRKDLIELIKYTNSKGMITYITTNGTLLTQDYIDKLGDSKIDVINVSVDSVMEFDDSKKSYLRSKKVLQDLIKSREKFGFLLTVNLVVTRKNIDAVIKTLNLFNDLKIPVSIGFVQENTYSKEKQDPDLFFKTDEEKKKLYKVLDEIKRLKKKDKNLLMPTRYMDDIKKFVNKELEWNCCAGKYHLAVDSDGKFIFCAALPPEDISIFDIDKDYFRKFSDKRDKTLRKCTKMCLSNCVYEASYVIKNPFSFVKDLW